MADQPSIYLTQVDLDRLFDLVQTYGPGVGPGADRLQQLESELVRAVVVPRDKIPKDVVTMNSRVVFEDETTGEKREITLVYPKQADIGSGKVSVLVPVGTALLGVKVGQSIDWELPNGAKHRYKVVAVPYQGDETSDAQA
ncbi:MAG: nucleoside diphosphate kinase regulator [Lautropia sp.]